MNKLSNADLPAFPIAGDKGLTKRELFAAIILAGVIAGNQGKEAKRKLLVEDAVQAADWLLKELAK